MDVTVRCTLVQHFYELDPDENTPAHAKRLASVLVEFAPEDAEVSQGTVNIMITNPKYFNKYVQGKMYTLSLELVK